MSAASEDRVSDSKSVSVLIAEALKQFSQLIRSEFELARAELLDKGQTAARGAAMVAGGGVLAVPSVTLLLMALAALLIELGMRASLACLVSGGLGLVIAGVVAWSGMKHLNGNALTPRRTLEQLQLDAATAKEHF